MRVVGTQLYWKVGKDLSPSNNINVAAVCFMWCTLPAFGAAAYIPSIVMERPLFVRRGPAQLNSPPMAPHAQRSTDIEPPASRLDVQAWMLNLPRPITAV